MLATRRISLLTTWLLISSTAPATAQLLTLGLRGGASLASMDLPESGSPDGRSGVLVGSTATLWFNDQFAFQFDALYLGKGFNPNTATGVTTSLALSYLEVPLVVVLSLPRTGSGALQARVQAGGAVDFRVRCNVEQGGSDLTGITDCKPDNVATFDLGLVGGFGLKIGRGRGGITLDATYTRGLIDVNLNEGLTARNRALRISAAFLFPIL